MNSRHHIALLLLGLLALGLEPTTGSMRIKTERHPQQEEDTQEEQGFWPTQVPQEKRRQGGNQHHQQEGEKQAERDPWETPEALVKRPQDLCLLPREAGPCKGSIPRYFFNRESGNCEQFIYGGCGGNENRFRTLEECQQTCPGRDQQQQEGEENPESEAFAVRRLQDGHHQQPQEGKVPWQTPATPVKRLKDGVCPAEAPPGEIDPCHNHCATDWDCESQRKCCIISCGPACLKPLPALCLLPAAEGRCKASFPRYFYNQATGSCGKFLYSGCEGNENNFATREECQRTCPGRNQHHQQEGEKQAERDPWETPEALVKRPQALCLLRPESGPCKGSVHRYYYKPASASCEEFTYGGCGGNENNFETREECQRTCPGRNQHHQQEGEKQAERDPWETPEALVKRPQDLCLLPCEVGPCLAFMPRYYYNSTTGSCKRFIYGGCQGNGNNFATQDECLQKCAGRNQQQQEGEENPESEAFAVRRLQDGHHQQPQEGEVPWQTPATPVKRLKALCLLRPETGPCKAYVPRYHYSPASGSCEEFTYGGCGGNENNFETREECQRTCPGRNQQPQEGEKQARSGALQSETAVLTVPLASCYLPPDEGSCKAAIPRYYFNPETFSCEEFIYGGCDGNGNRFTTREDCRQACLGVCILPVQPGPCTNYQRRYYYNAETERCETFMYGGCQGNENNFLNRRMCVQNCPSERIKRPGVKQARNGTWETSEALVKRPQALCLLEVQPGPCRSSIERYFYDSATGHCKKFIYGGCHGNKNNFETREECLQTCPGRNPQQEEESWEEKGTLESQAFAVRRPQDGHHQQEGEHPEERGPWPTQAPQVKRPQEVQNPLQCPRTEPGLLRPVSAYCIEGARCPGDELCCRMRNIRKCTLPIGVHPGYCPREQQKQQTVNWKRCSRDTDCAQHEKCCQKDGHQKCVRAEPAHPGLCPKTRLPRVGVPCANQCTDDRDCDAAQKCCFSRCGLRCVNREQHHQDQDQDEPSLTQGDATE